MAFDSYSTTVFKGATAVNFGGGLRLQLCATEGVNITSGGFTTTTAATNILLSVTGTTLKTKILNSSVYAAPAVDASKGETPKWWNVNNAVSGLDKNYGAGLPVPNYANNQKGGQVTTGNGLKDFIVSNYGSSDLHLTINRPFSEASYSHEISWDIRPTYYSTESVTLPLKGASTVTSLTPKALNPRWFRRGAVQSVTYQYTNPYGNTVETKTRKFWVATDFLSRFYVYPIDTNADIDKLIIKNKQDEDFLELESCKTWDVPWDDCEEPSISKLRRMEGVMSYVYLTGFNSAYYELGFNNTGSFNSDYDPDNLIENEGDYDPYKFVSREAYVWTFNNGATKATTVVHKKASLDTPLEWLQLDGTKKPLHRFDTMSPQKAFDDVSATQYAADSPVFEGAPAIQKPNKIEKLENYVPVLLEVAIGITVTGEAPTDFSISLSVVTKLDSLQTDDYYIQSGYSEYEAPVKASDGSTTQKGNALRYACLQLYGKDTLSDGEQFHDFVYKTPVNMVEELKEAPPEITESTVVLDFVKTLLSKEYDLTKTRDFLKSIPGYVQLVDNTVLNYYTKYSGGQGSLTRITTTASTHNNFGKLAKAITGGLYMDTKTTTRDWNYYYPSDSDPNPPANFFKPPKEINIGAFLNENASLKLTTSKILKFLANTSNSVSTFYANLGTGLASGNTISGVNDLFVAEYGAADHYKALYVDEVIAFLREILLMAKHPPHLDYMFWPLADWNTHIFYQRPLTLRQILRDYAKIVYSFQEVFTMSSDNDKAFGSLLQLLSWGFANDVIEAIPHNPADPSADSKIDTYKLWALDVIAQALIVSDTDILDFSSGSGKADQFLASLYKPDYYFCEGILKTNFDYDLITLPTSTLGNSAEVTNLKYNYRYPMNNGTYMYAKVQPTAEFLKTKKLYDVSYLLVINEKIGDTTTEVSKFCLSKSNNVSLAGFLRLTANLPIPYSKDRCASPFSRYYVLGQVSNYGLKSSPIENVTGDQGVFLYSSYTKDSAQKNFATTFHTNTVAIVLQHGTSSDCHGYNVAAINLNNASVLFYGSTSSFNYPYNFDVGSALYIGKDAVVTKGCFTYLKPTEAALLTPQQPKLSVAKFAMALSSYQGVSADISMSMPITHKNPYFSEDVWSSSTTLISKYFLHIYQAGNPVIHPVLQTYPNGSFAAYLPQPWYFQYLQKYSSAATGYTSADIFSTRAKYTWSDTYVIDYIEIPVKTTTEATQTDPSLPALNNPTAKKERGITTSAKAVFNNAVSNTSFESSKANDKLFEEAMAYYTSEVYFASVDVDGYTALEEKLQADVDSLTIVKNTLGLYDALANTTDSALSREIDSVTNLVAARQTAVDTFPDVQQSHQDTLAGINQSIADVTANTESTAEEKAAALEALGTQKAHAQLMIDEEPDQLETLNNYLDEAKLVRDEMLPIYQDRQSRTSASIGAFSTAYAAYNSAKTEYKTAKSDVDTAKTDLIAAKAALDAAAMAYYASIDTYMASRSEYFALKKEYDEGMAAYLASAGNNDTYTALQEKANNLTVKKAKATADYDTAVSLKSAMDSAKTDVDGAETALADALIAFAEKHNALTQATLTKDDKLLSVAYWPTVGSGTVFTPLYTEELATLTAEKAAATAKKTEAIATLATKTAEYTTKLNSAKNSAKGRYYSEYNVDGKLAWGAFNSASAWFDMPLSPLYSSKANNYPSSK